MGARSLSNHGRSEPEGLPKAAAHVPGQVPAALALEGKYIDKKCPFTGNVAIRGKIIRGVVTSAGKMTNTITIRRDYLHYITKYKRYEKRHKMVSVHCSPAFY